MKSLKIVKCKRCGTEYEMPNIAEEVIMEDCPVCKKLDEYLKGLLHGS
jgi:rubrerythrin